MAGTIRDKLVLLNFWGYWCGPCVVHMPLLIELHEKFADKGLAIVGVHVDNAGEVDTAAKLDEKIAGFKKRFWSGKDLPFPIALASHDLAGPRSITAEQYGVEGYGTTILIDRSGKIVGRFEAANIKEASEKISKLLAEEAAPKPK